jgi:hypothetical protein
VIIHGACHCGNIRFSLTWDPDPVKIEDPGRVSCSRCGIVPVVTCRIDGHLYAVVSVNAFEGVAESLLRRGPASFEGEDTEARLARRKRNWIADVTFR